MNEYGRKIRNTVQQHIGIPVSIGVAPTKNLAKLANRLAKKSQKANGVLVLTDPYHLEAALKQTEICDIWGIGRQYARKLENYGYKTAYDLSNASDQFVKKHLTIVGMRLLKELRGEHCLDLEMLPPNKQNICTSRSFGKCVTSLQGLQAATANYVDRCAYKLRKQKSCAGSLTVFVMTNSFNETHPQYSNSVTIKLPVASNSSLELIHYANLALDTLYREGYKFKKSGVIVSDLRPEIKYREIYWIT